MKKNTSFFEKDFIKKLHLEKKMAAKRLLKSLRKSYAIELKGDKKLIIKHLKKKFA